MNTADHALQGYLWRALTHAPAIAIYWASLAYRAGIEDGRQQLLDDLHHAGQTAATTSRDLLNQPTHAELQRRRGAPHAPQSEPRAPARAARP